MGLRERSEAMFRRFERSTGDDAWMVLEASGALDLREFDLFELAWRNWTGGEPDRVRLEQVFADYMFRREVPAWVRHLAREVLRRRALGLLSRDDFGAAAVRRQPKTSTRPRALAATAVVSVCITVALLFIGTYDMQDEADAVRLECTTGMAFVAETARNFTGRTDPFNCRK